MFSPSFELHKNFQVSLLQRYHLLKIFPYSLQIFHVHYSIMKTSCFITENVRFSVIHFIQAQQYVFVTNTLFTKIVKLSKDLQPTYLLIGILLISLKQCCLFMGNSTKNIFLRQRYLQKISGFQPPPFFSLSQWNIVIEVLTILLNMCYFEKFNILIRQIQYCLLSHIIIHFQYTGC